MDISIKELFEKGRTYTSFQNKPVPQKLLEEIYDLTKMGPTSANCCPLRIIFVQSEGAKKRLVECVMPGNAASIKSAPITALFMYDERFADKMHILFPHNPGMAEYFKNADVALDTGTRNSTLQAAYFMVIARSKGLACGPMSGFDPIKLETAFCIGSHWKANFICTLGYADGEPKFPRLPRLSFNDVCRVV